MMVTSEEAARLRIRVLKGKALRHLRNAAFLLEKMRVEARGLEATIGPGFPSKANGSGAHNHKEIGK